MINYRESIIPKIGQVRAALSWCVERLFLLADFQKGCLCAALLCLEWSTYLLYPDESGTIGDPTQRYFVLAGVAVFERIPHWIEQELDRIASRLNESEPSAVELYGSPMLTGKGMWRNYPKRMRELAMEDTLRVAIRNRSRKHVRLFASVLEKQRLSGRDIGKDAFEQLSSRFDQFLWRLHKGGDTQKGLIVFDRCSTEARIQTLAREFKRGGHSFGTLRNFVEVPVFLDSQASRMIQLADMVAYAIYRHFESGDSRFYEIISCCFDAEGGVVHGLSSR